MRLDRHTTERAKKGIMMANAKPEGLALLRAPFPANQISKLPKPTKKQTDDVRADFKQGIRCQICGAWHHRDVVHLDYVGHAALTDRLLDCDPSWNWEPAGYMPNGLPVMENGGMWIKLTVCGVTRFGYGSADGKQGGDAVKEVIGDALRNAAMRFGAALDLWHKGDLHGDDEAPLITEPRQETSLDVQVASIIEAISQKTSIKSLGDYWTCLMEDQRRAAADPRVVDAKNKRKNDLTLADTANRIENADIGGDGIPEFGDEK